MKVGPRLASRVPGVRAVPARLKRVRHDTVMFESWHGRYSDSPRAISEELLRRDAPYEQIWALDRRPPGLSDRIRVVTPDTPGYLAALGQAGTIVNNNTMLRHFRKKPGVVHLQTWHGTPLKRIAFDIESASFIDSDKYFVDLRREVASWDHLISASAWSTPILRQAFRYDGDILETGYPRNDLLSQPDRADITARARRDLGLPDGMRTVLYAPTWRDSTRFSLRLELEALADALGDDHLVLLRAHQLDAAQVALKRHPRILDVSSYPEIGELFLVADALITDYSSVMFDYAVTGKPMLFFVYDLDEYRDALRGFYFGFEAEAPGPLLKRSADVVDAIGDLDAVAREHEDRYARFRARYCHLEDGRASARVVDAVFPGARA